jgi:flagellum-specific ATP synthase
MALYRRNEDLITIGAYAKGANPKLDLAIAVQEAMGPCLRQSFEDACVRAETMQILSRIFHPEQE